MKSKKNLVFIGMMGSGKTSIGSLVAKKLKLNFFDIDAEIEKKWT
jgi:shikimate kinase